MKNVLRNLAVLTLCLIPFLNNASALSLVTVTPSPLDPGQADAFAAIMFGVSMLFSMFFSLICYCIPLLIGLGFFAVWIWMLVDLLQREEKDFGPGTNNKTMWLLIVLLTGWIGSLVYYFMIYSKIKRSVKNG